MQTFLFYPYRADGRCLTFTVRRLMDEDEALRYAEAVLDEHVSADRVAVWQGDRRVGIRLRAPIRADARQKSALVVEDCFLQAQVWKSALEEAGFDRVTCCGDTARAAAQLERSTPDVAVVDLDLGQGINFDVAALLRSRAVPFVFVTGYEDELTPAAFADIAHVCKPASAVHVVAAVRQTLARRVAPEAALSPCPAG